MEVTAVIGGPGCGKTEALLTIIEEELKCGNRVAYVSFTKKAAEEGAQRARAQLKLDEDQTEWFRTVHSTCYRVLGLNHTQVMGHGDWRQLGELLGLRFSRDEEEGPPVGGSVGDRMRQLISLSRARTISLREAWQDSEGVPWFQLLQFQRTLHEYKNDTAKLDFDDMLGQVAAGIAPPVPVDVALIDEAQDLTMAQWHAIDALFPDVGRMYIAGDPCQAIFRWSGAALDEYERRIAGATKRYGLRTSYRVPSVIHQVADGVLSQIPSRWSEWLPRGEGGAIERVTAPDQINLREPRSFMLLARNTTHLKHLERVAVEQGVAYRTKDRSSVSQEHVEAILAWEHQRKGAPMTPEQDEIVLKWRRKGATLDQIWHDALRIPDRAREHYLTILRNGERLQDPPRVYVGTIHSVKGGEADRVLLLTDLTYRTHRGALRDPVDAARCFFVGVTRARERLTVCAPMTGLYYRLGFS